MTVAVTMTSDEKIVGESATMDSTSEALQAMLDRDSIRQCLVALARGEDRRDAATISASLWPDSQTDYGVFQGSFAEYLAWVVPGAEAITNTQHVLGQSYIVLDEESAQAETQVISYHRVDMGAGERDTCIGGRYLDRLERRSGEWRIAERTMLYDWFQDWGDAIDWSQGVMGLPFSAPHFSGRAVGDYSEAFFRR
ncbi:MAG: nuclear transport factor 2 family protein [Novosphingobium sp.]